MAGIVTLTLNPTIDNSSEADTVQHTHKVRTTGEKFDPGGGGINVARVLSRLGSEVEAVYFAGGVTGSVLRGLLDRTGLRHRCVPIINDTRISLAVYETRSGKEYRFVPQGPEIKASECGECLDLVRKIECSWLVLSGSLPRGAPDDFYAQIVDIARGRGIRVVLDTSGTALKSTLAQGGVHLVKPSLGEMEQLVDRCLSDRDELVEAATAIIENGQAKIVVVSMGHNGAMLVQAGRVLALPAIPVEPLSAVGAGDSFVAAMTHGLAAGRPVEQAFRLGIAAGTAAVLTPGTDLCHRRDVERLAATIGVVGMADGGSVQ